MPMLIPRRNKRKWELPSNDYQARQTKDPFYQTYKWRKLRNEFIKQHPLCVMCKEDNTLTPAYAVDHITPIKDGGERFNWNNLQSLCKTHHAVKSSAERRGLKS